MLKTDILSTSSGLVLEVLSTTASKELRKTISNKMGVETIFCIPYLGLPSMVYGRKIREQFKSFFGIDVKIVFKSIKVKDCFSLKCQTPLPLLANVVYRFKCLHDIDKVYIGKTKRHLATR